MEKVNLNGYGVSGNEEIIIEPRGYMCGLLCTGGFLCS